MSRWRGGVSGSAGPQRLSDHHEVIALLCAAGYRNKTIRAHLNNVLGFHVNDARMSVLRNSPAIRARVEQIRRERLQPTVFDPLKYLEEQRPRAWKRMEGLSQQEDDLKVAKSATSEFLARTDPVTTRHEEDRVSRIAFDAVTVLRFEAAIAERTGRTQEEVHREVFDVTPHPARLKEGHDNVGPPYQEVPAARNGGLRGTLAALTMADVPDA